MQKQEAVILSAQFSGFLKLIEGLSNDRITELMNEIHTIIQNAAKLHQGEISRYTGEKLVMVFNGSSSRPSSNAIDVALELKDHIRSYSEKRELDFGPGLKSGLASGEVLTAEYGSIDSKQSSIMGEAVNHANRICEFAGNDQILVDANIHGTTKKSFEYQSLEPIPLKNTEGSLPVFLLTAKKRKKLELKASSERKIVSEMVGRDREFEVITMRLKELSNGKGSIMNIVGKAGIGKSRLLAEIKVQPDLEKIALYEGRALSSGENQSFHPIIHILKAWANITEEDIPDQSYVKLLQSVQNIVPEQSDEIFPFIATMMGLDLKDQAKERIAGIEGESLEKLILKNLRDLIIEAAEVRPIMIILEDLHWADASSIVFLKSLYKLVNDHPILFINVLRPGYEHTGEHILRYIEENFTTNYSYVFVGSLPEQLSLVLIENLLQKVHLPEKVNDLIIKKSEGNPFFIEEILRSFIDQGIIEFENNEFQVTDKIDQANIPESINEVILSRVDKLDEKTKELLRTASVIGRNFYFKVLEEAADTIGELDQRLQYLKDVQLINEGGQKDEIEYLFKHALAQQATYDSILKESRKDLHLKIARSIEKVFNENLHEFYGSLAQHYEMAEDLEKTENYLFLAGKESLKSGAPSEALSYFRKGLEIYQASSYNKGLDQKLATYYYNLGISCYSGGYNIETINYIDKFETLHKTGLPHNRFLLITGAVKKLIKIVLAVNFKRFYFKNEPTPLDDVFIKLFAAKSESMVTIDPKRVFFEILYFTSKMVDWDLKRSQVGDGVFAEISGNFIWTGISFPLGRKILKVYDDTIKKDKKLAWMKIRYPKLMLRLFTGDFTVDQDEDDVFDVGLKAGAFWETTTYLFFSAYIYIERGNLKQAENISNRILEVADSFENVHSKSQHYRITAVMLMKSRLLDQVIDLSEKGIDFTGKTGHLAVTLVIQSCRIIALCLKNQLSEASEILNKARPVAVERKRGVIFYSTYLLARCHYEIALAKISMIHNKLTSGEKKKLVATGNELIKYSKKFSGNLIEAYRLSGIIYQMCGNQKKALESFLKSVDFGLKSAGNLELSRTYFELGKLLSNPKVKQNELNGRSAGYFLEKAEIMFREMDLQWDLNELKKFNEASTSRPG
jgi:class 3 adenylate cyclase/tetratricopeptide (TPR) repeat protein